MPQTRKRIQHSKIHLNSVRMFHGKLLTSAVFFFFFFSNVEFSKPHIKGTENSVGKNPLPERLLLTYVSQWPTSICIFVDHFTCCVSRLKTNKNAV